MNIVIVLLSLNKQLKAWKLKFEGLREGQSVQSFINQKVRMSK